MNVPTPTALALLTAWRFDPFGAALALAIGAGYCLGVRRVRAWPRYRTASAAVALLLLSYLCCGFLGVYARVLFWAYATQVSLLLVVVPAILGFGRPISLAKSAGLHAPARWLGTGPGRVLASPATGPFLVPIVLAVVVFTGVLPAVIRHAWAGGLLEIGLVMVGFLIALPLGGDDDQASGLAIAAGIFLGLVGLLLDAIPGIVLRLSTHPVALSAVTARHQAWAPDPLTDQQRAGAVLWCLGEVLDLPFLGLLVYRWVHADAREAARIDRELDQSPERAVDPAMDRPWWETDPSRLGARRAREFEQRYRSSNSDLIQPDPPAPTSRPAST